MFDKKAYMKKYNKEHYAEQRAWLLNHPKTQEQYKKLRVNWGRNHPKVRYAQRLVQNEPMAAECTDCGVIENLERHHPDYNEPSEFVTLCKECHAKRRTEK